jgi:hypothetical protein
MTTTGGLRSAVMSPVRSARFHPRLLFIRVRLGPSLPQSKGIYKEGCRRLLSNDLNPDPQDGGQQLAGLVSSRNKHSPNGTAERHATAGNSETCVTVRGKSERRSGKLLLRANARAREAMLAPPALVNWPCPLRTYAPPQPESSISTTRGFKIRGPSRFFVSHSLRIACPIAWAVREANQGTG